MILFEQFNSEIVVNLIYILAAMLFILGLKMLGSPETARRGNLVSASGMFLAVVITLLDQNIIDFSFYNPVWLYPCWLFVHCHPLMLICVVIHPLRLISWIN